MTHDTWHVTRDTWTVTLDMWHVTRLGGWTFSQNFSSLALTVCDLWYYEDILGKGWLWINQSVNHEAVCRTAPAKPGLSNITGIMQLVNSGCLNMFKNIRKSWLKSSFLESLTSLDWLLYPTENELSGSSNSEWNLCYHLKESLNEY